MNRCQESTRGERRRRSDQHEPASGDVRGDAVAKILAALSVLFQADSNTRSTERPGVHIEVPALIVAAADHTHPERLETSLEPQQAIGERLPVFRPDLSNARHRQCVSGGSCVPPR